MTCKPFTHWRDYLSGPISRTTALLSLLHWFWSSRLFIDSFNYSAKLYRGSAFCQAFLFTLEKEQLIKQMQNTLIWRLCVCVCVCVCMSVKGQAQSKDMNIEYLRWLTVLWMLPCNNIIEPSLIRLCSGKDLKEGRDHHLCYNVHAVYWERAYEAEEVSSAKSLRNMYKILKLSKSLFQKRISYSPLTLYWSDYFLKYAFIR